MNSLTLFLFAEELLGVPESDVEPVEVQLGRFEQLLGRLLELAHGQLFDLLDHIRSLRLL